MSPRVDDRQGVDPGRTAAPTTLSREARVAAWRTPRPPLIEGIGLGVSIVVCLGLIVGLIG